eukprot:CAMPEP_0117085312 /NCGR_PEP_ID=MMETSP0472-20121206/59987_1 /TAXON_ID=693140 ORGANISM="Tiarina fusus, Strain LIS" /NCGR_SAMPLE_ID=MMETSP0472 /ASSEMBLY_ACC=CAM_ASM_000603 /LENGTH=220 /DNA_ID=CAMNT_0004814545 /DNA_START=39 /DNA_END=701 /DNA_ORIENTATION=+
MWIGHVISCMDVEGIVKNVQALEEGYQEFKQKYPFLTTSEADPQNIFSIKGYPFPVEINYDFLFLSVANSNVIDPVHIESLGIDVVMFVGDTVEAPDSEVSFVQVDNNVSILQEGFAEEFLGKLEEMENNGKKVLLHAPQHQDIIAMAVLYLLCKKKVLRDAYNFVIQCYWKEGVTLPVSHLQWLAKEEIRILGSSSVQASEIESGSIVEVTASKYCILS